MKWERIHIGPIKDRKMPGLIGRVIAGATDIADRGGLSTVTVKLIKFPEEDFYSPELLDVFTVDPVSLNFEPYSDIRGAEAYLFFLDVSGDESGLRQYLRD